MRFDKGISVQEIANLIGGELHGDETITATGLNEIHKVESGDITFVDFEKYYDKSLNSAATIIIIDKKVVAPTGKAILIVEKPFEAYNFLAKRFRPKYYPTQPHHPEAKIHPTAIIEPGVYIGENVTIGEGSYIQSGTVIRDFVTIGKNVIIQSGNIIGSEAFYYKKEDGKYIKWHTVGRVIIEDNVEIGSGCTIDRGVSGDTIIGEGTKFDSQIHIGHGATIGKNCLITAQVGIAGKTHIGDNVVIYGQVGVAQNITIGDNAVVLAKSGVSKSIDGDKTYFGIPAGDVRDKFKELATLRRLSKD